MRTATILPATFAIAATMALALPFEAHAAMQCVTYARDASGLNLKGDAWKWWEAAAGVYDRGNRPREGAVLVFKRQGKMAYGHVSVVRHMKSSRELLVDHANWAPHRSPGRGKVTQGVPVVDVSPNNDWSQVRVFYRPIGELGTRIYQTQGFVYRPGTTQHQTRMAQSASSHDPAPPSSTAAAPQPMIQAVALTETAPSVPSLSRIDPIPAQPQPVPAAAPAPHVAAPVAAAPAAASVVPPVPPRAPEPARIDVSRWAEQA